MNSKAPSANGATSVSASQNRTCRPTRIATNIIHEQLMISRTIILPNAALSVEVLSKLRRPKRPRAIILAPTRELARQILSVLKSVGHVCKISSDLLVGGDGYGKQRKKMADRPVDILVATPGRLVKHRDAGDIYLGSVRHVVIDEMDTLLFKMIWVNYYIQCYIVKRLLVWMNIPKEDEDWLWSRVRHRLY